MLTPACFAQKPISKLKSTTDPTNVATSPSTAHSSTSPSGSIVLHLGLLPQLGVTPYSDNMHIRALPLGQFKP